MYLLRIKLEISQTREIIKLNLMVNMTTSYLLFLLFQGIIKNQWPLTGGWVLAMKK